MSDQSTTICGDTQHEWTLKWSATNGRRLHSCQRCAMQKFTDHDDTETLAEPGEHAPWVSADHKAVYAKSLLAKVA